MYVIGEIQSRCMDMVREMTEYVISNPLYAHVESLLSYSAISSVMKGHFSVSDVAAIEDAYVVYTKTKMELQRSIDMLTKYIKQNKEHL